MSEGRAPGTRAHPLYGDQAAATADDSARERASEYLEWFASTHQARLGTPFIAKPSRDFPPALRLIKAYPDAAKLQAGTDKYLSMPKDFDDGKPRTPGRLEYLASALFADLAKTTAPRGRWECQHDPPCATRTTCTSVHAKAFLKGEERLEDVQEALREDVRAYAGYLAAAGTAAPSGAEVEGVVDVA